MKSIQTAKRISVSILMTMLLLMSLSSCGDGKDNPTPPGPTIDYSSNLIKKCSVLSINDIEIDDNTILCGENLEILSFVNRQVPMPDGTVEGYLPKIHEQYNDYNCYIVKDADMKSYCPFVERIKSISFSNAKWNSIGSGDLNEHIRFRYKTYKEFIANKYSWPAGIDGPCREKTLAEFNRDGGDELIDANICFEFDEEARSKCFVPNIDLFPYEFVITVTTMEGKVFPFYLNIAKYSCMMGYYNYKKLMGL